MSIIASIDVGTSKICTILADMGDGIIFEVLGVNVVPSEGMREALVVDMKGLTQTIRESVEGVEQSSGREVRSAYVGISGKHIRSFNNWGTVAITGRDHRVSKKALKRATEASKKVRLSKEEKMIHAIPRQYMLDGQARSEKPIDMYGYRLDVESHIVLAGITFIENLLDCVKGAGIDVLDIVSEPIADSEALLEPEEREAGVLLADIGAGTTDITTFKDGELWYTSALPMAGNQVTRDLAQALGIRFNIAEELKKKYGSVVVGEEYRVENIPLEKEYKVSYADLCYIIRARVEEIFRLVLLNLSETEQELASLVLCGGTANLPGIEALAQEVVRLPTRLAMPKGVPETAAILNDPAFATGVGLLLWGAKQGEREAPTRETLLKRFLSQLTRLFTRPKFKRKIG